MPKPQLFLLHYAGGNCYSFQFMMPYLKDFEVTALELPGRGKRMKESLLRTFDQAAFDICKQLEQKITAAPFVIYGHSMGAYLSLRITNMLKEAGKYPGYLIVSGNAGPCVKDDTVMHLLNHADFIEELRKLGGVPDELIANKELLEYFEPILRADFEIAEKHGLEMEPPVNVPMYAMMGDQEEKVDCIKEWGRFTNGNFDYEILEGNHFFIHKHPHRIATVIKDCYDKAFAWQHA